MTEEKVTVVITNRNGERYLEECISSVLESSYPIYEIIVTDNASVDNSMALIRQKFPGVKILEFQKDIGHSGACARGIEEAGTRYVLILDNDTKVTKDWLFYLMDGMKRTGGAICTSRVLFYDNPDTIHSDGGYAHYVGSMILLNGFRKLSDAGGNMEIRELGAAGTVSMLIDKEKIKKGGSFDEDYYIYLNDFEFTLRTRLSGEKIYSVPQSIVYHKGGSEGQSFRGTGQYPAMRAFYIFRNRWFTILKLYSLKTIVLCLPALLVYEASLAIMAAMKGLVFEYLKAAGSLMMNLPNVIKKRKAVKKIREISDGELLTAAPLSLVPGGVSGVLQTRLLSLLNGFLIWYWNKVKVLI